MNNQNLIIYENNILYEILIELSEQLELPVIYADQKNLKKKIQNNFLKYLVLTSKDILSINNKIILNKFPISIFKLVETINIEFMKLTFHQQSEIKIGKYIFNLNSREMKNQQLHLKLTEKEINSIIYLSRAKKTVRIQELQSKVWGYQSKLETHTVETHIYRLRKKILKIFNDNQFLKSTTGGYQIN